MTLQKKISTACIVLVLAIFAGALFSKLRPAMATTGQFSSEEIREANESIPMTLLGQFRTNLDAYLWLKTEEYLHGGVSYRPYTEKEREQGMRETEANVGGLAEHSDGPTVIPSKEEDWRGIFGDFERNLQPYRPGPARHGDPEELIPWYRVQTIINPLDVNAYVTCAFFMGDFARKPEEALAFLEEGARNNPRSPEIQEAIGQLYFEKWKNYDKAIPHLRDAIALGKQIPKRDDRQEKAFGDAYLFLAKAYREKGELNTALQTADEGVKACPANALVRVIDRIVKKDLQTNN
jgi:tetratricopeptide (TPR) repeat protein